MRAILVLSACVVLLSPAVTARTAPPTATFLGVIGAAGAMTPIAVFDGRDWWNAWPWGSESDDEMKALPVPASLEAIPSDWLPPGARVPRDWKVLRRSGATARFKVLRPVRATLDQLVETFAMTTTLRAGSDDDALAIAGPGVLGRFVNPGRDETARVLRQLTSRIEVLERAEVDRWRAEAKKGGTDTVLPFTRVYRASGPDGTKNVSERPADEGADYGLTKASDRIEGKTYYSLNGEKLLRIKPGDDCKINLSTNGLVVVDRSGKVTSEKISSWAFAEYCGDAGERGVLLGTVRIGTQILWVERVHVEDGFGYRLFDPLLGDAIQLRGEWALRAK